MQEIFTYSSREIIWVLLWSKLDPAYSESKSWWCEIEIYGHLTLQPSSVSTCGRALFALSVKAALSSFEMMAIDSLSLFYNRLLAPDWLVSVMAIIYQIFPCQRWWMSLWSFPSASCRSSGYWFVVEVVKARPWFWSYCKFSNLEKLYQGVGLYGVALLKSHLGNDHGRLTHLPWP